jgi:hypothetical protein
MRIVRVDQSFRKTGPSAVASLAEGSAVFRTHDENIADGRAFPLYEPSGLQAMSKKYNGHLRGSVRRTLRTLLQKPSVPREINTALAG